MTDLSDNLIAIRDLELSLGNVIERVDEPAGTECPLALVFKKPLHFSEIAHALQLRSAVQTWESKDPHYEVGAGFVCRKTNHVIAGPLQ